MVLMYVFIPKYLSCYLKTGNLPAIFAGAPVILEELQYKRVDKAMASQ